MLSQFSRVTVVLLMACLTVGAGPASQPTSERFERLLKQLDSDELAQRQAAADELITLPIEAVPLVEAALKRRDLPLDTRSALEVALEPLRRQAGRNVRLQQMIAWNRRTLRGAYDQVGSKNPKWDAAAHKVLELAAINFAEHAILGEGDDRAVTAAAAAAGKTGCDDPLIKYLVARFQPKIVWGDAFKVSAALRESNYPAVRKIAAANFAIPVRLRSAMSDQLRKQIAEHLEPLTPLVEQVGKETADAPTSFVIEHLAHFVNHLADGGMDRKEAWELVDRELAKTLPDEHVVRLNVQGIALTKWAWDARGRGFANTVTDQGWKGFEERLAMAQKVLERAYELYPNDPAAPTQMLTVELGQGQGRPRMEQWFQRAIKADPTAIAAYQAKMYYLEPKWHGSLEDQVAFGRQCLETGLFDTHIPLMVVRAHHKASGSPTWGNPVLYPYLGRDDVWADISAAYEGFLAVYPGNEFVRTRYAHVAHQGGRWKEAQQQLQILGDRAVGSVFGEDDVLPLVRREVEMRVVVPNPGADPMVAVAAQQKEKVDVFEKVLAGAYDLHGKKDAKWDAAATAGLVAFARHMSETPACRGDEPEQAREHLRKAIEAGCDDPVVRFAAAYVNDTEFSCIDKAYRSSSFELLSSLHGSAYQATTKFLLSSWSIQKKLSLEKPLTDESKAAAKEALPQTLDLIPAVVKDQQLPRWAMLNGLWHATAAYQWARAEIAPVEQKVTELLKAGGADAMLIDYYKARAAYYDGINAWPGSRPRSSNLAGKDFKVFVERMNRSREMFEDLWRRDPKDPTAAEVLILVALELQHSRARMDFWFRQAMSVNPEDTTACEYKFKYLDRIGTIYDINSTFAFGVRCANTGLWSSRIPLVQIKAYDAYARWVPGKPGPSDEPDGRKLASEQIWPNIQRTLEGYLNARPNDHLQRTRYARMAALAGMWEIAAEQFKVLGDNVRVREFGSQKRYEDLRDLAANPGNKTVKPIERR